MEKCRKLIADEGKKIEYAGNGFEPPVFTVSHSDNNPRRLPVSEGDEHSREFKDVRREFVRDCVGKRSADGYRKGYIDDHEEKRRSR